MEISVYTNKLPVRRARSSRFRPTLPAFPPLASRRRRQPPWRVIGAAAVPLVLLGVAAYVARRRVFQGVAVLAKAVEEVADTIEDAAEDLGEAAQAKAKSDGSGD
jgi:hypothetical protein